jgi:hypothetical protein
LLTILVLGGYGAVGAKVVAEARANGDVVFAAGRDPARADRVVDLRDRSSYGRALRGVEVVVNASGLEDTELAVVAAAQGAAYVDITASSAYVAALERLSPKRPILLSVGLAPGLTNLLAAALYAKVPGPLDLVVLLGAGERHGDAAARWSYALLGRTFVDPADGRTVRNYTQPRRFELAGYGRRHMFRADFSDQHTLTRDLGSAVRTYFGLDSTFGTLALAALTWVPGAARLPTAIHLPGTDGWLALARSSRGTTYFASGRGQSQATAVVAAGAARAVLQLGPGVHHLHRVLSLADLPIDRGIVIGPGDAVP